MLRCLALHSPAIAWECFVALHRAALHYVSYVSFYCIVAFDCVTLRCLALHSLAIAWECFVAY